MKYLCLVYLEADKLHAVPDRECQACGDGLRKSGLLVAAEALEPVDTATTVRIRNGRMSVTDGPFAETKEQLAGLLPDRGARPQRRHPGGVQDSAGARGQHRGASGPPAGPGEVRMSLITDFKFALRSLARVKGLAITVVATLALGIGANAAIFSVVRGVLLRPLVNKDEDRLIYIRQSAPGIKAGEREVLGAGDPRPARPRRRRCRRSASSPRSTSRWSGSASRAWCRAGVVSGSYFDVMGLRAGAAAGCSTRPTTGRRRRARRC